MTADAGQILPLVLERLMITSEMLVLFILLIVLIGVFLIVRLKKEINDRKVIETALTASEKKFRMAFDTSPNAFSITTLPGGIYVDVNRNFTLLTGYEPDEIIGRSVLDLKLWKDVNVREQLLKRLTGERLCKGIGS